ncbi:MAG: exodeoxyribonuclease V subunit gamma, partial [Planctomycetes bacterium]|nr:exodeoxyribonuclease V subunit gamma [Planctomycetota bacterium]
MLRVWLSNDLTELALAAGALLEPDPLERALAGATVVVPDRVLGTFFEDALTRRDGACAGLDLLDLEALCARLLAEADPPRRLVDADLLRGLLVDALADLADLDDPDLAPVRDYLAPDPGRAGALAGLLARRFLSYDRERPDLLRAWREAPPADPVARWQRALFLRALDALARLEARRPGLAPALTLGQLARDPAALDGLPVPPRLVVFVGPTLAPAEAALLARLAERTEVDLFAHTPRVPCAELAPPGVDLAALPPLAAPGPPPEGPLAAWLQADHARVEALIALAGRDPARVRGCFRVPAGDGLLARLQRALLLGRTDAGAAGDGSLTTSSFTGKRAEVEHAAGRVLTLLAADDALPDTTSPETESKSRPVQLHEVALLVPAGLDAYRPLIASVFGAAGLPVRFLAGAPDDRLVEACEALLALVGDPCPERPALAAVLTHPAVLLRAGLGRAEVVRWLDDLPVRLGLDRAQQAGTYLDDAGPDLFHACGGARRLVLGAFCEGERVDEERLVSLEGEACAPLDVAQDQRPAAARFALLVASLTADVRAAAAPRPLAAWGAWLAALVGAYLAPADDGEEALLERLQRRLRRLGADDDAGAPAVAFAVAAACARDVLGDLRRGGSRHLAGGVLVAERLPPLPLRQVQVLGLG